MHSKRIFRQLIPFVLSGLLLSTACTAARGQINPPGLAGKDVAVSQSSRIADPQVPPADREALSAGNRAFAANLYQQLRHGDGNLIFSPYSLSLALAMTYAGAQGETAQQMAATLQFELPAERLHPAFNYLDQYLETLGTGSTNQATPANEPGQTLRLNIANSLWGQQGYPFLPAFLDLLAQNYGAGMQLVDFSGAPEAAREAINAWVSQQTSEKIQDLFPAGTIDTATRLALVNAIYFKASWQYAFDPATTRPGTFHLKDGGQVSVPMMASGEAATSYLRGDGFQAVGLPYLGGNALLVVLLPDAGQFDQVEGGLDAQSLEDILTGLDSTQVQLSLPKFKIESSFNLPETLAAMGMPAAFDPATADFSGMDGSRNLFISQVVHKAIIAVDEQGTEAAAATGVAMSAASMLNPIQVQVDRPFMFFIYERNSGTLLFAGRVLDPSG